MGNVDLDQLAFDAAPTGLAIVDIHGRVIRVNGRLTRMLRTQQSDLVGRSFQDLLHPEDRERAELRLSERPVQTMHDLGRVRFVRPNEASVWAGVAITRVSDDHSGAAAVIHVPDLTDLVRAEERLGLVTAGLHDGVVVFDPVGGIVSANPAAVYLLGPMVGHTWGQGTRDVDIALLDDGGRPIPPDGRAEVSARLTGESAEGAGAVVDAEGETRWLEIAAHPLERSQHERWVVASYKDVSEHRRVEAALRARVEADRSKSEFLSRMSHELRTPLNAVLGFAQLLEMSALDDRQRESVKQILSAGRHLLDLVDDLLDLDRIERDTLDFDVEPVRLSGVLREASELVQALATTRGITLDVRLGGAARAYVVADRRRLRQVLLNLFSNAIKYNRPAGAVTVACRQRDDTVVVRVHDTGAGLTTEEISRIFTPFERLQADERGIEGMGVGLALSKRLMEGMGGVIGVESDPSGSTFWIMLRAAPRTLEVDEPVPAVDAEQAADVLARTAPSSRRVLYIEDNDASRYLMRELLERVAGVEVITATGGGEGLALARAERPHAILLDLHLPDMRGEDVLTHLQADTSTSGAPVIIVSADAVPERISAATAAGAAAYLTKPVDAGELFAALESVLDCDSV